MTNYDLKKMSVAELKRLHKDVASAIETYEERQRAEAKAKVEGVAKEMGFTISELFGPTRKRKSPVAAKYRHPENADVTWSGRGRHPKWFKDALASGKTPDELSVE